MDERLLRTFRIGTHRIPRVDPETGKVAGEEVLPRSLGIDLDNEPLTERIWLSRDLGWDENNDLHQFLRRVDLWDGVPFADSMLLRRNADGGGERQRVDLLYLSRDGRLLPCEVKIKGESLDSHGQLLRYLADYFYNPWTVQRAAEERQRILDEVKDAYNKKIREEAFQKFVEGLGLRPDALLRADGEGALVDEGFKPQMRTAVRYLNAHCGLRIHLVEIRAKVGKDWQPGTEPDPLRIELVEIDP